MKSTNAEDPFTYALSSNSAWAGYKGHQNPDFFPRLASGQSPDIRTCCVVSLSTAAPLSLFIITLPYFSCLVPGTLLPAPTPRPGAAVAPFLV